MITSLYFRKQIKSSFLQKTIDYLNRSTNFAVKTEFKNLKYYTVSPEHRFIIHKINDGDNHSDVHRTFILVIEYPNKSTVTYIHNQDTCTNSLTKSVPGLFIISSGVPFCSSLP